MGLGTIITKAEALVVAVPTFVFVAMLPGLLYVDLAFDVQRSVGVELLLSLSPPSAAALVLREVCSLEALAIAATWRTPAPISQTPLYAYSLVLLLDFVVYLLIALALVDYTHRTKTPSLSSRKRARASAWARASWHFFSFFSSVSTTGSGPSTVDADADADAGGAFGSLRIEASLLIDGAAGAGSAVVGSGGNGSGGGDSYIGEGAVEVIERAYRAVAWGARRWMLSPMLSMAHRVTAYVRGVEPQGYVLIQTTERHGLGQGLAPGQGLGQGQGLELHSTTSGGSGGSSRGDSGRGQGSTSGGSTIGGASGSRSPPLSPGTSPGTSPSTSPRYETVLSVRNLTKQYTSGQLPVTTNYCHLTLTQRLPNLNSYFVLTHPLPTLSPPALTLPSPPFDMRHDGGGAVGRGACGATGGLGDVSARVQRGRQGTQLIPQPQPQPPTLSLTLHYTNGAGKVHH